MNVPRNKKCYCCYVWRDEKDLQEGKSICCSVEKMIPGISDVAVHPRSSKKRLLLGYMECKRISGIPERPCFHLWVAMYFWFTWNNFLASISPELLILSSPEEYSMHCNCYPLFSSSKSVSTALWRTSSHSYCWPGRSMHYQFQPSERARSTFPFDTALKPNFSRSFL